MDLENQISDELESKLGTHLIQVGNDPTIELDEKLLDECALFLAPQLIVNRAKNVHLISQISSLSPKLQQDPTSLVRLLEKLVEPFTFSEILALQPPVDFESGLSVLALPYNRLMLQLIRKASNQSTDLAALANMPSTVKALIQLWLATSEAGVADTCGEVLVALLEADKESTDVPMHGTGNASELGHGGQGLLWRRFFGDKDIYSTLFSMSSSKPTNKQQSLAQARILSFAPKLGALDWSYLTRSHHPEVERQYGLNPGSEGFLDFLAVHAVDYKGDVLLHITLMQFYQDLIAQIKQPSSKKHHSVSLAYIQNRDLHRRTIAYWLTPNSPSHDPLDLAFLEGPSARYLASYASHYPNAFLQDGDCTATLERLHRAMSISANQWAQGQSPSHDLHVVASLPRISLLPQNRLGVSRQSSPLLSIPSKSTNADALNTLASICRGPHSSTTASSDSDAIDDTPASRDAEAAAARAVFAYYVAHHPTLFADLVTHAEIVALPEKAKAAINVIASIACANWQPLPATNGYSESETPQSILSLPSEEKLTTLLPPGAQPEVASTGIGSLLAPGAREAVFPFLLRPAQKFANLVGGRGDPESNAYKVATAKWDCLVLVQKKLQEHLSRARGSEGQGQMLLDAIDERVREGVWGKDAGAGGQVASLEM